MEELWLLHNCFMKEVIEYSQQPEAISDDREIEDFKWCLYIIKKVKDIKLEWRNKSV